MKYAKHQTTGSVATPVLQMVVFVLAIGLLGLLGYRQLDRVLTPRRTVVVLSKAVGAGEKLSAENLTLTELRAKNLSGAVLEDPGAVIGRVLARDKRDGEPLYPSDLATSTAAARTPLAARVPEGRVVTTLMLTNLTIPYRELNAGDRVDILAAGNTRHGGRSSAVIVRGAYVLGYLSPPVSRSPTARGLINLAKARPTEDKAKSNPGLMLAVLPTDVLPLAEIDGSGVHLSLALHNSQTVADNSMLEIKRSSTPRYVDVITGEKRESVQVSQ